MVLFDEIEKAHEDVWNILLQILDDGRITDSQGRTVDFKNTVIVMTSNIGAKALTAAGAKLGFCAEEKKTEADADKAYAQAKEIGSWRSCARPSGPEFLNRIDDIIVFRALTEQDIEEVARRMLKTVAARMETMGIHLDAGDEAVKELAKEGFDPKYGARPLRRAIQSKVEDAVAEKMLDGTLQDRRHRQADRGGRQAGGHQVNTFEKLPDGNIPPGSFFTPRGFAALDLFIYFLYTVYIASKITERRAISCPLPSISAILAALAKAAGSPEVRADRTPAIPGPSGSVSPASPSAHR